MTCDICNDSRKVTLAVWPTMEVSDFGDDSSPSTISDASSREFPCPQCRMVPFRKVRAMKVSTAYKPEDFAKMQMPIERGLAARFGEYLYREGLIKFSTSGSADFGAVADKITVTAHLGVVTREDAKRAGAEAEVALTRAPPLPDRLRKRFGKGATRWQPPPEVDISFPDQEAIDEFDEPKDAIANRFSGLEI